MNELTYTILDYAGVKGNNRTVTTADKSIIYGLLSYRNPEKEIGCILHQPNTACSGLAASGATVSEGYVAASH